MSQALAQKTSRRRGRQRSFDYAQIRDAAAKNPAMTPADLAEDFKCSIPTIKRALGNADTRKTKSSHPSVPVFGLTASMPAFDNPALMEGRTIYPRTVISPKGERVFKSGENNGKIGGLVLKGKWKGFAIYTLTLEERPTCPRSCLHWRSCMGNKMHYAVRFRHGAELEWQIMHEIPALELQHPGGFAIRLHSLGDFYSVDYVYMWEEMLHRHPALHCFGYSARIDVDGDPIARALALVVRRWWNRFAIRFSDAPVTKCSTISVEHPHQAEMLAPDAIVCPEQISKTESCSTCGLCWSTTRRIAFITH
jgi:hypothetical protein